MRAHRSKPLRTSRLRPLAACLAIALSADVFAGSATTAPGNLSQPNLQAQGARAGKHNSDQPAVSQTRTVLNCSDGATDSLRDIITNPSNPNHAQSGDTVDLSQLPMLCAMTDSTITLTSGEIAIDQASLTLQGPSAAQGTVTISGGHASRVLKHSVSGTLSIHDLTIANGYYHSGASFAYGGCIKAFDGSVYLRSTTVSGCVALSDTAQASGGGVHTLGSVILVLSSVSGNQALAPMERGYGGGIAANKLFANYSSISANVAGDGTANGGLGGGAYALAGMSILASTIDRNTASYGGGLQFRDATVIVNSTISGNIAHKHSAALYASGDSLAISNSTIALNHADTNSPYGAVHFEGISGSSSLTLQSSIIGNNTADAMDTPSDLSMLQGVLSGADNLVIASSISDPNVITVTADPKLGPLQFNGGWTMTHALLPGSPALGKGNHNAMPAGFTNDQRGPGYPRTTGTGANVTTDIGAFEFDTIFSGHFDFK
jgi:hypothetical protein